MEKFSGSGPVEAGPSEGVCIPAGSVASKLVEVKATASQTLLCGTCLSPRLFMYLKYLVAVLLLFVPFAFPQNQSDTSLSANDLVRRVIANELRMQDQDHTHWMYEVETAKAGVKETKAVAGTKDGTVTLLVARDGQPLAEDEQNREKERMNAFIHDREAQEKRKRAAEDDAAKTKRLLSMLPDAFHFSYAQGGEDTGDTWIREARSMYASYGLVQIIGRSSGSG
jgi:hypothetical protein